MTTERSTTEAGDGGEILSVVGAEAWLRELGQALLAAPDHDAARLVFNEATRATAGRLPYGVAGRAIDLLEKRLRQLGERDDHAQEAP